MYSWNIQMCRQGKVFQRRRLRIWIKLQLMTDLAQTIQSVCQSETGSMQVSKQWAATSAAAAVKEVWAVFSCLDAGWSSLHSPDTFSDAYRLE